MSIEKVAPCYPTEMLFPTRNVCFNVVTCTTFVIPGLESISTATSMCRKIRFHVYIYVYIYIY